MNIYLVERTDEIGYDETDSYVCYAETEEEARIMFYPDPKDELDTIFSSWIGIEEKDTLEVTLLGINVNNTLDNTNTSVISAGIILSSFNTG